MLDKIRELEKRIEVNQICFQVMARALDEFIDFIDPAFKAESLEQFKKTIAFELNLKMNQARVDSSVEVINKIAGSTQHERALRKK